jgi:hypothetical protein
MHIYSLSKRCRTQADSTLVWVRVWVRMMVAGHAAAYIVELEAGDGGTGSS